MAQENEKVLIMNPTLIEEIGNYLMEIDKIHNLTHTVYFVKGGIVIKFRYTHNPKFVGGCSVKYPLFKIVNFLEVLDHIVQSTIKAMCKAYDLPFEE